MIYILRLLSPPCSLLEFIGRPNRGMQMGETDRQAALLEISDLCAKSIADVF